MTLNQVFSIYGEVVFFIQWILLCFALVTKYKLIKFADKVFNLSFNISWFLMIIALMIFGMINSINQ